MKRFLVAFLITLSFVSCSTFVEDYVEVTTEVAEAIADNPVVETVATAYADKVTSAAKADVDPIGYCKDKIEEAKETVDKVLEEVF